MLIFYATIMECVSNFQQSNDGGRNMLGKKWVKSVALMLVILLISSNSMMAATTFNDLSDLANHVYLGYNSGTKGPISITKAVLVQGTSRTNVYVVAFSGTEDVPNQSTGIWTDLKSGFDAGSPYLEAGVKAIRDNIPNGSKLILTGHSLGGMIAQQLSATSRVKDNYQILNVVTMGSPLLSPWRREGTVKRVGDTSDPVPYLSAAGTFLLPWQVFGLQRENGGYNGNALKAHVESYKREDVWGNYDVLGFKNGTAKLQMDLSTMKFYYAPVN